MNQEIHLWIVWHFFVNHKIHLIHFEPCVSLVILNLVSHWSFWTLRLIGHFEPCVSLVNAGSIWLVRCDAALVFCPVSRSQVWYEFEPLPSNNTTYVPLTWESEALTVLQKWCVAAWPITMMFESNARLHGGLRWFAWIVCLCGCVYFVVVCVVFGCVCEFHCVSVCCVSCLYVFGNI